MVTLIIQLPVESVSKSDLYEIAGDVAHAVGLNQGDIKIKVVKSQKPS